MLQQTIPAGGFGSTGYAVHARSETPAAGGPVSIPVVEANVYEQEYLC
jgi:hypothetical protein